MPPYFGPRFFIFFTSLGHFHASLVTVINCHRIFNESAHFFWCFYFYYFFGNRFFGPIPKRSRNLSLSYDVDAVVAVSCLLDFDI